VLHRVLEIACFNLESALIAQSAGADRIEFCENYQLGGLTPSPGEIKKARERIRLPLHVMIRHRGGDFNYTNTELEQMKSSILLCKKYGVDGIVFGILSEHRDVQVSACQHLVELAKPMRVCFHRAIDSCADRDRQIETLISLGVDHVLTSGGKVTAIEGAVQIASWQKKFGDKITIMPGGGIRSNNLQELMNATSCREFHSAALLSNSELADAGEIKKMKSILREA
jgi:copper homeostasis protein